MLVVPQHKALILKLTDSERILTAIPSAKKFKYGSSELVAIPHKADEVRVLRNLGLNAPAPILHYYHWRGRYVPYEHQKITSAFLTMNKKCLVLNEIGCGKTVSALWAADYLMDRGEIKKVLIVSPLSTLERVWADSIYTSFTNRTSVTLHGTAERRKKLMASEADFYIINHDGFDIIAEQARNKFDLIIVDEAAVYRNPGTTRFRAMRKYLAAHPDVRLWLMTGTPTPNEPTDAWALAKLIESPALTATYTGFRDKVMMKVGQWRFLPRPNSPEIVSAILQPSIRFTREECLDLPGVVYHTREAELSPDQDKAYKAMMKHLTVEAQQGQITAANEAIKMQKLVQITCGVAYDTMGNPIEIGAAPRIRLVEDIINEAGDKVIVFVPLTGALNMLERELSKKFSVAVVNGDVSAKNRNEIFNNFQNETNPRILVAHPGTMAHGLTLTASSTIVWFGPITSNEQYTQANGRIQRIGQRHTANIIHIESTKLERTIFDRLRNKQKLQGVLLDMIGGVET